MINTPGDPCNARSWTSQGRSECHMYPAKLRTWRMSALCAYDDHIPALTQITLRVARHSNHVNNTVPSPQPHPESLPLPNL